MSQPKSSASASNHIGSEDPIPSTNELDDPRYIARKLVVGSGYRMSGFLLGRTLQIIRVMVFARLFLPDDIGTISLALSVVAVVSIFTKFGFRESVIRSKDDSKNFANSAFTLSLILGVVACALILVGAPLISNRLSADIDNYVRFLAFMALAIPLRFPKVFWEKEIEFKHPSIALLIPELVILIVAVGLEVTFHLGVWSLLIGHALGFLSSVLYIWLFAEYRPRIRLERKHIRVLLGFGTPLMVQRANVEVMDKGDNLIVGGIYGTAQLAYYDFAWGLPMMISSLTASIDSMLFPVYARLDDNKDAIKRVFNSANKMWSITGSFLGFLLLLYADEIVHIFYGPNWEPVVPILRVMTLSFIIRFCTGYSYNHLALIRGRTRYMMNWGLVNTLLVFTLGLFMILKLGPIGGAWFWVLQALIMTPLVRVPLIRQELRTLEFVRHIWQPVLSGLVAFLLSYLLIQLLPFAKATRLVVSVIAYLVIYPTVLSMLDRKLISDSKILLSLALRKQDVVHA